MEIYPNGYKEEYKDYVSIYLYLIDSNKKEVKAEYQFSIRKSNGGEYTIEPSNAAFFIKLIKIFKGQANLKVAV